MKLIEAKSDQEIETAKSLFREYQQYLDVNLCFQGFEAELASLPGKYAEPTGAIILAEHQDEMIGCVAVRPLSGDTCEMKRLYVKPAAQGLSAGRLLAKAIIQKAQALGYQKMQLDTLERLKPALNLYESLGFKRVDAYYDNPLSEVVYLELDLSRT